MESWNKADRSGRSLHARGPGSGRLVAAALFLPLGLAGGCYGPLLVRPAEGTVALWLDGELPEAGEAPGSEVSRPGSDSGPAPLDPETVRKLRLELREAFARAETVADLPLEFQPLGKARSWIARGELDAAAVELRDRIAQSPQDFIARVQLGDLRVRQGRFTEAVALLEESLRLAPGDPEGVLILSKALAARRESGDLERATDLLDGLVGSALVDPAELAHTRVTVFHFRGQWGRAAEVAREALEKFPGEPVLRLDLAQSLLLTGRHAEALTVLEPLTGPSRGADPEALWLEAGILRRMGRFRDALERLEALGGDEYQAFRESVIPPLETVAQHVTAEALQGRRLFFLPGEMEEILASDPSERRRLEVLVFLETAQTLPPDHWRVLDHALEDSSLEVRIAALRVMGQRLLDQDRAWETLIRCLQAPEPRLRAQAALRLHLPLVAPEARLRTLAATLYTPQRREALGQALWSAIEREEEGIAFESLHQALQAFTGERFLLFEGDEADPEVRARLRARWKEVLKR